jgi:hypothetical protein
MSFKQALQLLCASKKNPLTSILSLSEKERRTSASVSRAWLSIPRAKRQCLLMRERRGIRLSPFWGEDEGEGKLLFRLTKLRFGA